MTGKQTFKPGDRVTDRDGFDGVVVDVTYYQGREWNDVRFSGGDAVRYPEDLNMTAI